VYFHTAVKHTMRSLYHCQYRSGIIHSENSWILIQIRMTNRFFIGPCAAFPVNFVKIGEVVSA